MPLNLSIISYPPDGGAAINRARYRVNGGTPIELPSAAIGTYTTVADIGQAVDLAFGNSVGWGPYSATKTISTGAPEILLNPSFDTDTVWAATEPGGTLFTISGGNLNITRRADPANASGWLEGVFQDVEVINGRTYDIEVVITAASGGGGRIKIADYDIPSLTPLTTPGTYTAAWTNTQFSGTSTRRFICSTSQQAANVTFASVSMRLRPL
jgi:hypothetical protein